jgi:proteasome lid subunit RPN8/RPN11
MTLWISSELLSRLQVLADADRGREVCGLLLGEGSEIRDVRPAANVAATPETRFEIDPAVLIAAHRESRSGGLQVIGCYHSHPTGRSYPSAEDARLSAPDGQYWIILGADDVTAWQAVAQGDVHDRFIPVALASPDSVGQR